MSAEPNSTHPASRPTSSQEASPSAPPLSPPENPSQSPTDPPNLEEFYPENASPASPKQKKTINIFMPSFSDWYKPGKSQDIFKRDSGAEMSEETREKLDSLL